MRTGIQQGDLLVTLLDEKPYVNRERKVAVQNGRYTFAYGEHTGHEHFVRENPDIEVFTTYSNQFILHVLAPVELEHGVFNQGQFTPGHHARTLVPGWHRVESVREVDPFVEHRVREVRD